MCCEQTAPTREDIMQSLSEQQEVPFIQPRRELLTQKLQRQHHHYCDKLYLDKAIVGLPHLQACQTAAEGSGLLCLLLYIVSGMRPVQNSTTVHHINLSEVQTVPDEWHCAVAAGRHDTAWLHQQSTPHFQYQHSAPNAPFYYENHGNEAGGRGYASDGAQKLCGSSGISSEAVCLQLTFSSFWITGSAFRRYAAPKMKSRF